MPKRFGPGGALEAHYYSRVQHEVDIYRHLGPSLNVAYLYGAYETDRHVDLVTELCTGGDLLQRVQQHAYSEQDAARVVEQLIRSIAQCHARGIVLRDVKPENYLFLSPEAKSPLKAIDFGLADYCPPGSYLRDKAGTVIYVAPEMLRQHYDVKCDVWSAGIIAYQLLTGRLPFAGEEGEEVSELYMEHKPLPHRDVWRAILYAELDFAQPPWDTLSPDARGCVEAMLQRDPTRRPAAADLLHHRWLARRAPAARPLADTVVQRLQRFGTYGRLKQAVLRRVAGNLAAASEQAGALGALFRQLDAEGHGTLPYDTVVQAVREAGYQVAEGELRQLVAGLLDNLDPASGQVRYADWLAAMADWERVQASPEWAAWLDAAWRQLDRAGAGRLTPADLNALLCGETCEVPDTVGAALRDAGVEQAVQGPGLSRADLARLLASSPADQLDLYEPRHQ